MSAGGEADRIISLYDRNSAAWDRDRGRELFEAEWLDRFVALLPANGAILDVGCGSGEPIARHLIERGFRITGVDSSPKLIVMCRERFPAHDWRVGDMRMLDLGRRFDGVIAWHSLFHLTREDQRSTIPRIVGHLKANGGMLFTTGSEEEGVVGEWEGEPLYHASLSPSEYESILAAAGLQLMSRRMDDADCGGANVWLAQMSPASGLDGSA